MDPEVVGVPPKPYTRVRSPEWPKVREAYLQKHPTCAGCGTTENLEVHHMVPYHLLPERELDPTNLITLCERPGHDCHFHFGHLLDWLSYNTEVIASAKEFLMEVKHRPT